MAPMVGKDHPEELALAQLFSTCIECFGLIHPGKEQDAPQRTAITKLGIQQARLLAWGDMLGILDTSPNRDPRLADPKIKADVEQALQDIIDRPAHTSRETQFEKYGLKPPKRFMSATQPSLDVARIESFRERLEILQRERWEVRRGMSVVVNHWLITDLSKFKIYLGLIKEKVDSLIQMFGIEHKVNTALKHDIRAFGWHPIFDKMKASYDMAKLRSIMQACKDEYPDYVTAAQGALDYLQKEYRDNYEQLRSGVPTSTEIPGAAAQMARAEALAARKGSLVSPVTSPRQSSFLKVFRPRSWRKSSKDLSVKIEEKPRSISHTPTPGGEENVLTPPMTPERSKSLAVPLGSSGERPVPLFVPTQIVEDEELGKVETQRDSVESGILVEPVHSAISRRDYWKSPW